MVAEEESRGGVVGIVCAFRMGIVLVGIVLVGILQATLPTVSLLCSFAGVTPRGG